MSDACLFMAVDLLQLDPNYARTQFWLGRVYSQKRMHSEAIAASRKILEAMPDSNLALTEMAYSLAAGRPPNRSEQNFTTAGGEIRAVFCAELQPRCNSHLAQRARGSYEVHATGV
jgi:tetratricopeptide (TPR) repeat protein